MDDVLKVHTRITVNLVKRSADALDSVTTRTGLSKTDTINRSLQLLEYWESEQAKGNKWLLTLPDGSAAEVRLI